MMLSWILAKKDAGDHGVASLLTSLHQFVVPPFKKGGRLP
jgi:hypothetical protein